MDSPYGSLCGVELVQHSRPAAAAPQAAQATDERGLRYVYGLGIHASPSPGIRGEVTRIVHEDKRAPGRSFPGGADDAEIADLRRMVDRPLPADLVEWLRVGKGDDIAPGGLYGVRCDPKVTDIVSALRSFPTWREHGWLPVAVAVAVAVADDGNGNHYVLLTNGDLTGCVGFIDQADIDAIDYLVATNLWTFLWFLLCHEAEEDDGWPFERNHVTGHDPAMATIPRGLQPWRDENGPAHGG
jgi:SMI1 / KNR4 family (SUKH-1)